MKGPGEFVLKRASPRKASRGEPPLRAPQCTLASLRAFVDGCFELSSAGKDALCSTTGLSKRHVGYAAHAALLLGLAERDGDQYAVTPAGRKLAGSAHKSEEERQLLVEAVHASAGLRALAPDLLRRRPPTKAELASQLERATGLNQGTAEHRAAMLLSWRKRLLQQELSFRQSTMWRQVEIKNFRSIASARVRLAPFTVVVGPNGSGKSNFVDALVLMRDVAVDASTAISARGGIAGVRRWTKLKPTDVTIDVRAARSEDELESRPLARHSLQLHSGKNATWSFSRETIEAQSEGKGKRKATVERSRKGITGPPGIGNDHSPTTSVMVTAKQLKSFAAVGALHSVYRYRLNPEVMRAPRQASDQTRLSESGDNVAIAVHALTPDERKANIILPMSKIIPGLRDITTEQVGRHLALKFVQAQGDGDDAAEFNATEMSDGSLRALGIILATHQMESDELLIIEEPEVSIHVGAAQLLFELLEAASKRGAVLITTHSADLLDAARDQQILVCEYSKGETRIGPLAESQRQTVREGLFSVAELMRSEPLRIERA